MDTAVTNRIENLSIALKDNPLYGSHTSVITSRSL